VARKKGNVIFSVRITTAKPGADSQLSGGPVGPPARWVATSNVEGGSGTEETTLNVRGRALLGYIICRRPDRVPIGIRHCSWGRSS